VPTTLNQYFSNIEIRILTARIHPNLVEWIKGMKNSISAYLSERVTIRTKAQADCPKEGIKLGRLLQSNNAT